VYGGVTASEMSGRAERACRTEGVTAIVATHDPVMLDVADRIVELRDGELFEHSSLA